MGRSQVAVRPDHWVPFAVVSGLKTLAQQLTILSSTKKPKISPMGKKLTNLPLAKPRDEEGKAIIFPGWKVSDQVKHATVGLLEGIQELEKRMLHRLSVRNRRTERLLATANESIAKKGSSKSLVLRSEEEFRQQFRIVIHWEREEYQNLINSQEKDQTQTWPECVEHQKLRLIKNRYPVVPGFSNKTRTEEVPAPVPTVVKTKTKREFFKKKQSTWKVKNDRVKAPDTLFRYGSKFGKSFPIIKRTAATSRYRFERAAIRAEKDSKREQAITAYKKTAASKKKSRG
jgi:hypothetical protein